ncbi:MAG: periplasmic heavy metal sensor [Deltaproteobacteria bacterium]|nr:periplasmic heavy metal sensor [Deltaproteobacteria bacterium]MCZ6878640.1 periplasmic heavy metal sensor [Acidobacteriota bacterium]
MKNKILIMTLVVFGVLLHFLFFLPAQANAEPALNPVFHEELGSILDEFYAHLQGLGTRWYRHFSERRPRHKRPLITFMLRHREKLELSSSQVQNLKRLRSDFEREAIRRKADIRVAELELETFLDGDPIDLSKVEAKVRQIEKLRGDHRLARIRTIEDGKAQLTTEQREKLRTLLAELQHPWKISGYANRLRRVFGQS